MIITNDTSFPAAQDPLVLYEDMAVNEWEAYQAYSKLINQGRYNDAVQMLKDNNIDFISAELWNMFQTRVKAVQEYLIAHIIKVPHHFYGDEPPVPSVTPTVWVSSTEISDDPVYDQVYSMVDQNGDTLGDHDGNELVASDVAT